MKFGKMKGKTLIIAILLLSPILIFGFWILGFLPWLLSDETKGSSEEGHLKVCKTNPINRAWLGYDPNIYAVAADDLKFYCKGEVMQKEGFYFIKKGNLMFKVDSTSLDKMTYFDLKEYLAPPKDLVPTEGDKKKIIQVLKEYKIVK